MEWDGSLMAAEANGSGTRCGAEGSLIAAEANGSGARCGAEGGLMAAEANVSTAAVIGCSAHETIDCSEGMQE